MAALVQNDVTGRMAWDVDHLPAAAATQVNDDAPVEFDVDLNRWSGAIVELVSAGLSKAHAVTVMYLIALAEHGVAVTDEIAVRGRSEYEETRKHAAKSCGPAEVIDIAMGDDEQVPRRCRPRREHCQAFIGGLRNAGIDPHTGITENHVDLERLVAEVSVDDSEVRLTHRSA
jgi:hypothetical protein